MNQTRKIKQKKEGKKEILSNDKESSGIKMGNEEMVFN